MIKTNIVGDRKGKAVNVTKITDCELIVIYDPKTKIICTESVGGVVEFCKDCGLEMITGTQKEVSAEKLRLGLIENSDTETEVTEFRPLHGYAGWALPTEY